MGINKVTVFGSGLIGAGWATHLLVKGVKEITLYDISEECIERGISILNDNLTFLEKNGVITFDKKQELISSITVTTNVENAVADSDLIIENGPEKILIKRQILNRIESFAKKDAIITSSTSGLKLTEITTEALHPERVLGVHPYHPVYLMPLLEINKLECTDTAILSKAMSFFESIDKKPVLLRKECDAYIGSRLMTTLLRESMSMIMDGVCTMQDIDDAFTYGPGMRYSLFGIFTTLQLAGGEGELKGLLNGPMGKATNDWIKTFCNWQEWPPEVLSYFENDAQIEMNAMLKKRDAYHGRNNEELEEYRDNGLLGILKIQKLI